MLPYALPLHNDISDAEWQHQVGWFSHSKYLQDMDAIYAECAALRLVTLAGKEIEAIVPVSIYHHWEMLEDYLVSC